MRIFLWIKAKIKYDENANVFVDTFLFVTKHNWNQMNESIVLSMKFSCLISSVEWSEKCMCFFHFIKQNSDLLTKI